MKKLVFLGILSFLIAAIWQLPLSVAKPYAEKLVKGLKLDGVSGTLWAGSAQRLSASHTDYGQVSWQIQPVQSLGSLSLTTAFNINGNQLKAKGTVAITPSKKVILDNTRFDVSARYLNKFQKQARLSGDIKGHLNHAEIKQNKLPIIDAIIDWKQGQVSSMLLKLAPGDYHAEIKPDTDGLQIKPSAKNAPLQLSGQLKLTNKWILQPDIKINSRDPGITSMLAFAGKPGPDGSVHVTQVLDLKPFINIK